MTAALVFLYKYQRQKLYKVRILSGVLDISLKIWSICDIINLNKNIIRGNKHE